MGSTERADFLQSLQRHRGFLRQTVDGITEAQAVLRPTASELSLGGLIKHVARTEEKWAAFAREGAVAFAQPEDWQNGFRLVEGETLASVLAYYADVAKRTDDLVGTIDFDATHPCPRRRGSPRSRGRSGVFCFTSSPKRRSTQGTPTSCGKASTAPRRWAEGLRPAHPGDLRPMHQVGLFSDAAWSNQD
ncbi:hypothetical protein GCM10029964_040950 [Kibdelosporangium lantanae]